MKTRRKLYRKLIVLMCTLLIAAGNCSAAKAKAPAADPIGEIIAGMSLPEKVGQLVIADFRNWNDHPEDEASEAVPVTELREELRDMIRRDTFGGIILFAENCSENEPMMKLINQMQEANLDSDAAHKVPLLIAIDQEGGSVVRLGQGTNWIGNMALAATGDPENAREVGNRIGEELSALGVNTDFAPVVDVNSNPSNPVIGVRSFSDDPDTVAAFGTHFLQGLQDAGTISSLKHFPGHGDVAVDSHTGFPMLDKSCEELKECELIPFQAAIDSGADMVMTAHIQYPQIETGTYTSVTTGEEVYLPATLSHRILTEILREDMGFDGVIVSDALNMAAIADNFDPKDIPAMALEAGIDMFLMPVPVGDAASLQKMDDFLEGICAQVEEGSIAESRIDESVRRILIMKENHGLLDADTAELVKTEEQIQAACELVGSQESHNEEWNLMQKAVTLLKAEEGLLPLHPAAGSRVLVLCSSASRTNAIEYARQRLVEEGILPEDVAFDVMVYGADTREECLKAVDAADAVIAVSVVFSQAELDPRTESGAASTVLDEVIQAVHKQDKKLILVSAQLPYDTARYTDADAVIVNYGSRPMNELPQGKQVFSVNLPAAICGIFGEYEFTGKLPLDIPAMDEEYTFGEDILYPRESLS